MKSISRLHSFQRSGAKQKNGKSGKISDILKKSYLPHLHDKHIRVAVKQCLG